MGLSVKSAGLHAVDNCFLIHKNTPEDKIIAIAGNPNVGKSTVFNALTGLSQHTGNWTGKTVATAQGRCRSTDNSYVMVDIPGTYSLMAHSAEEEVARNFICFGGADAVIIVCDATCLERNLNLVLQTLEITGRCILCVNLMDEAAKKKISLDLNLISRRLGIPVVGTSARQQKNLNNLLQVLDHEISKKHAGVLTARRIPYCQAIEDALALLEAAVAPKCEGLINSRWLSLRLLDYDTSLLREVNQYLGFSLLEDKTICTALEEARSLLHSFGLNTDALRDSIVTSLTKAAADICQDAVNSPGSGYLARDRRTDRLLTSRLTGYPVMIALLALVFWITIWGANYPSALLSRLLFGIQDYLAQLLTFLGVSDWLNSLLTQGMYRVLAWVVCVMLPPMAIFFPLFTLLEDVGYLPRIAYNLDYHFKKCHSCGKQALTMCMVGINL